MTQLPPSRGEQKRHRVSVAHLVNVGPYTTRRLRKIGITTEDELRRVGAVEAFRLIKRDEPGLHVNVLYSLHGALAGVHWRSIKPAERTRLCRRAGVEEPGAD